VRAADGINHVTAEKMLHITPLIRERIRLLREVLTAADFLLRRSNCRLTIPPNSSRKRETRPWR
jgi:hypothetical protein